MACHLLPARAASNLAERPGPAVPSRTSSLRQSRPGSVVIDGRDNCTSDAPFANARFSDHIPTLPSGPVDPAAASRLSFIARDDPSLGLLEASPAKSLPRSYSIRSAPRTLTSHRRSASCSAAMKNSMRAEKVKRWAGLTRTADQWDGLRRDPELWFEGGNCLVHLYARGQSRRGPAFRVPFSNLRERNCGSMFSLCFAQMTPSPGSQTQTSRRVSSGLTAPISTSNTCELYIPAPDDASREDAFQWHITTRNFFAFVFGRPLVGKHLGQAFVDLQERMHLFRSGQVNNHADFLQYAEEQGYRDLVDCPDYALAMLYYAEHYKLRDVWVDAFAHAVGMNASLTMSSEFEPISRITKALITRAYLEVDIHLGHVTVAVSNFIEDDMSPTFLGLGEGARAHLDRFRSFLHSFYVEKFGYWPPPKGLVFSKALYKSMYFDFQNLYDYLVDLESTRDLAAQKPASGGICVLQNVLAFDGRHDFTSLPHPLPLLPQHTESSKTARKTQSQRTLRTLTLGSKQAKTDRYMTTRAALTAATNSSDIAVTSSPLVKEYMRFERQCALNQREEKVSTADARKVRWLLIYGVLQYLVSAVRAPKEVRDTEEPTYPLCCLIAETLPWESGTGALKAPTNASINVPEAINNYLSSAAVESPNELAPGTPTALNIQPDCARDGYFTHTNPEATPHTSRPVSVEIPAPLRITAPVSRSSSIKSFRNRSLSALGSRRNSIVLKTQPQPMCEIIVPGYGNGLNEVVVDPPACVDSRNYSANQSKRSSHSVLPEGAGPETSWLRPQTPEGIARSRRPAKLELKTGDLIEQSRTPILDSFEMDQLVSPTTPDENPHLPSSSDSFTSLQSEIWSDRASSTSSQSSAGPSDMKYRTEEVSALGGLVQVGTSARTTPTKASTPKTASPITPATQRHSFRFSFANNHTEFAAFDFSPASTTDSTIGVALDAPPPQPSHLLPAPPPQEWTMSSAIQSFDSLPTLASPPEFLQHHSSAHKPQFLAKSVSAEPLSLSPRADQGSEPAPATATTSTTTTTKKEKSIDIFAALDIHPPVDRTSTALSRTATETDREIEAAIPPPIAKKMPDVVKGPRVPVQNKGEKDQEADRGRKKERRKSLGMWLRR